MGKFIHKGKLLLIFSMVISISLVCASVPLKALANSFLAPPGNAEIINFTYKTGLKLLDEKIYVTTSSNSKIKYYKNEVLLKLLLHSAQEVSSVNNTAIKLSKSTKRPVLLIGIARTGCPYTWAVDNWWTQLKNPNDKEKFYEEARALANKQSISNINAELIIAQQWIDSGKIEWFVHVSAEFIPSWNCDSGFDKRFLNKWKKIIEETSINLLFVDDSNTRQLDRLDLDFTERRFSNPSSFDIAHNFILSKITRIEQEPIKYYLAANDHVKIQWMLQEYSIVFLKPSIEIHESLIGKFPINDHNLPRRLLKDIKTVWWDNIDPVFGDIINEKSYGRYYGHDIVVHTSIGEINLSEFMELKLKEFSGWFSRNNIDLLSYAVSQGYIEKPDDIDSVKRKKSNFIMEIIKNLLGSL